MSAWLSQQPLCARSQLRSRSGRGASCTAAAVHPQPQPPPAASAPPRSQPPHAARDVARRTCVPPLQADAEPAVARRGALTALATLLPLAAAAAGPARAEDAVETVEILMGGEQGGLDFVPNRVALKRNKAYRLVLSNPSKVYHNFVATEFLLHGAYWLLTKIGEAGETEWYVVPHKLGLYEFKCTVVGHENMKGIIEVVA